MAFVHYLIFPVSLFLSASLLFLIQPMAAKVLLPIYGGTPAVWTVCMLFFQALLLVSYAYVWGLSRFKGVRTWRIVHLLVCLLSVFFLPLIFSPQSHPGAPELDILKALLLQLGLPLLVIGASAPLLQFAYSQTKDNSNSSPYYLYAASNAGSLLALLSYPFLVERFSTVSVQFQTWNIIYILYLFLLFITLIAFRYPSRAVVTQSLIKIDVTTKIKWVFYSFVPCSLMLGVTFYISTDVAATPLFWVFPLALYLLTFVITFAKKPLISHSGVQRQVVFFLIFPIIGFIIGTNNVPVWQLVIIHLTAFFMVSLFYHGELVRTKPCASQLTTFYFCLALGGALAGVFNGFLAPRLFNQAFEYPLVILLSFICFPRVRTAHEWRVPIVVFVLLAINFFMPYVTLNHAIEIIVLSIIFIWSASRRSLLISMAMLFIFIFSPWFSATTILNQQRNFYGIKHVFSREGSHVLMSQSTLHGFQLMSAKRPSDGTTAYYGPVSGVVKQLHNSQASLNSMVLGLGTGILACQFGAMDKFTAVEIDEQVIDIAKNPDLFTYLQDCQPTALVIPEDGRIALTNKPDKSYDILIMDAFSSDAIPVHLLTLEAFALYQQKLSTNGAILVNISNRHLGVLPVITAAGRQLDMIVMRKKHSGDAKRGQFPSEWALLTINEALANTLIFKEGWQFVTDSKQILWTNDYSNLVPLIKW